MESVEKFGQLIATKGYVLFVPECVLEAHRGGLLSRMCIWVGGDAFYAWDSLPAEFRDREGYECRRFLGAELQAPLTPDFMSSDEWEAALVKFGFEGKKHGYISYRSYRGSVFLLRRFLVELIQRDGYDEELREGIRRLRREFGLAVIDNGKVGPIASKRFNCALVV